MITLTYGYKVPEATDRGPVVFPAMEDNIERLDGHSHDGVDSTLLDGSAVVATSASIPAGSWASPVNGVYEQTVNMPAGLTVDNTIKEFRFSDGSVLIPTIKKITVNTYKIYLNDNTQTLTVFYK